jgi:uncharacterized membrane protein YheB (UPF0754 family)
MDWRWILFPLIGALIGYSTNLLAVRMLFRPRNPFNLLGLNLQGLIPRRRREIGERVAEIVSQELVRPEKIREAVAGLDAADGVKEKIQARVAEFMAAQLEKLPPMIRAVVPESLKSGMQEAVVEEIEAALPDIAEQMAARAQEKLDVHGMVIERIDKMDFGAFEKLVLRIAKSELRAIELLGGVIGLLIGIIQAALNTFLF